MCYSQQLLDSRRRGTTSALALSMALLVLQLAAGVSATDAAVGFELYPAANPGPDQAYWNASLNSWGGSVYNDSGNYHMFMSAMGRGKLLSSWSTASYVVRAVAKDPAGPYTAVQDVLPAFHHNPQVVRHPDGTFLLFTIGQTLSSAAELASRGAVFRTELHYASNIAGPWRSLGCIINGSNPAPHVVSNGTVVVAYKGEPNGLRIATAPHWRGPYTTLSKPGSSTACCGEKSGTASCCGEIFLSPLPYGHPYIEDFFIWFDRTARRWSIVLHQYELPNRGMSPGGFAYSADASLLSPWRLANRSVYGLEIALANGSKLHADRQRPKLLFDAEGEKPRYLFNGIDQGGQKAPTHTFAQEIKSWTPPYED